MAFFTWCHAGLARFYETARGEGRLGRHFATGYLAVAVLCVIVCGAYVAAVGLLGLSEAVRTALFFGLAALLLRSILMMGLETHRAARNVRLFGAPESASVLIGLAAGVGPILAPGLRRAAPFAGLPHPAPRSLAFYPPAAVWRGP